ncbi:ATP-binding cassette G31, PLEIOTROPIC DRUG RESISTANCE 3, pleiotropic drug resistance 3 [Hibiscus trionum]|uniref:ATP-binding cassette G31, PLEIOTROPIC DRUG RESISTANCE 3, pleiotropic drug resistance 3 n=1 Tax=Hibiscus trionum TaxID=183268 RepID=A0A9W7I273_HIBTR|nr:ATP-binding cassette G31, PLEIOTROPIC DRUG RESISTANCE 3, pleiotropic drug resistance 3 [Hibiscus trionum]
MRKSNALEFDLEAGNEETFQRPSNAEAVQRDEEDLVWEALSRLPSVKQGRFAILRRTPSEIEHDLGGGESASTETIDVTKLDRARRELVVKKALATNDQDNYKLLAAIKDRLDRVELEVPKVEVRFQNINIEAKVQIGSRALPTLINVARDFIEDILTGLRILRPNKSRLCILKDISGVVRPGRMTLLLGPPGSGKSTLLLALAGKLDNKALKVSGDITYNGTKLDEFYVRRTSAYISQTDNHIPELTVRETLDFAARCQGASEGMAGYMKDLTKLEKEKNIRPAPEIDAFMKASSVGGKKHNIATDYVLKVLGLDVCSDTVVGNDMLRGVSGGQRKRVTTGEMIVGPRKTLFMDEISTGLDSSTTYQIVKCVQNFVHLMEATVLMGLLQPAPETFELFDDLILLSEGHMVYQGPREGVLEFFESLGFKLPPRKGVADFLQEVTSKKDQAQYWADPSKPYVFIPVSEMATAFKNSRFGKSMESTLSVPYDKSRNHPSALSKTKYAASRWELLNSCFAREILLITRHSFLYVFRTLQVAFVAFITGTIFLRTRLHPRDEINGNLYISALFFGVVHMMFNGFSELPLMIFRLPIFYKQRDNLFHPAWIWSLVSFILRLPYSVVEAIVWSCVVYYTIGFAPSPGRFFRFMFIKFVVHQMAIGLFRMLAAVARDIVIANTFGSAAILLVLLLGGFLVPKDQIKPWWSWATWLSPLQYAQRAVSVNEFTATRWKKISAIGNNTVGYNVLHEHGLPYAEHWYWLGVAVLLLYALLFNLIVTLALIYLNPLTKAPTVVADDTENSCVTNDVGIEKSKPEAPSGESSSKKGMILPFQPLAMSFQNVNYFVDMPKEMKAQGIPETRLQLLSDVSGVFSPGVLTALVGSSGAGKTTLLDVLSGRKTGGYIEGDIRIAGYSKEQKTFARISGYVEQNDIHSPQVTVEESLWFSSSLKLPKEISKPQRLEFVEEVMRLVELDTLRNAIVGLPGSSGLSTEQRKRLTIAVELVANPSIIFMDEPTSGLDARAAAIVMRTIRNTVDTGRTVVCTIHQPSIDIFEAFDELLLLKRGGRIIYGGKLGLNSQILIDYFQGIEGVPSIPNGYNPATWMLEVTNPAVEQRLGIDFADIYKNSAQYREVEGSITRLSVPPAGSKALKFSSTYSQGQLSQFLICLKKQNIVYWRSPRYNLVRLLFTTVCAIIFGSVFWDVGNKRDTIKGVFMIMGALYSACLFLGVNNASSVQPIVSIERTVFYRERAARMYAPTSYAAAQGLVELPYIVAQTILFGIITYFMINFERTARKFFLYLVFMFLTFTYFTFYGLMAVGLTPSQQVAAVVSSAFYSLWNLLSGFLIPEPRIPGWWMWFYHICPIAWTLKGIISSQLGDVETMIIDPTFKGTVKEYISTVFGIHSGLIAPSVAVLIGFCVLFFGVFTLSVKFLNFQKR